MAAISIHCDTNFKFGDEDTVLCILCDLKFSVCDDIQPFLSHMLDSHNFLFEAPLEILDIRKYLNYWRKLKNRNIQDYCIVFNTNTELDAMAPQATYYLLSNQLPEDQEIRSVIRENKLKFISNQMRTEWQDKSFSRKCVYCSNVIEGGLYKVFDHIKYDHNISLGNNIVFGAKLLDIIEDKLQKLLCLFCENQFKNHLSLREHMRKKHHKSLNPKNKIYDKFYLVNYVKPGTSWEEAKQELHEERDDEDFDKEQVNEQLEWEDWKTGETTETTAICLFCNFVTSKIPSDVYCHMAIQHKYNFEDHTEAMSFYERVKLINYIRTKISCNTCSSCSTVFSSRNALLVHMVNNNHFVITHRLWDDIKYFIPFLKNDGLLHSMKDDEVLGENSSGYGSSNPDEIVFPESIPRNFEIVEPSDADAPASSTEEQVEREFKCLFCSYITNGLEAKSVCMSHMECNHCFSYKTSIEKLPASEGLNFVNYIRFMTDGHRCFCCLKQLNSETALVVHLQLCRRTKDSDNLEYLDGRWRIQFLNNDSFILDLEKRIHGNVISNKVSSKK